MSDASTAIARLAASLFQAVAGKSYGIKNGALSEIVVPPSAIVALTTMAESTASSTDDFDFLTLTLPADTPVGSLFEAQFFGTQSQAAVTQSLLFYVKVNGGAAVIVGTIGTGSSTQSYRAISGRALIGISAAGASGSYMLGGDFTVNSIASVSSNSASPRTADTRAGMTITLGIRCSVLNAANINRIIGAFVKQVA